MQDDSHLPSHLTIHLVRTADEGDRAWSTFTATSPQFPDVTGSSSDSEDAVTELLWWILNTQDLSADMVDAFLAAGYSHDVVQAWRCLAQGRLNRRFRYDVDAALAVLKEYTDGGVPALTACRWLDLEIIDTALAIEAHAAGGTPEDALGYIGHSETHKWWKWDYDIDPWIRSGLPFERGQLYAYNCSVEEAREWEQIVAERCLADADVSLLLRSRMAPEAAQAHLAVEGHDAATLVAEARRLIEEEASRVAAASAVAASSTDPWGSPSQGAAARDPWEGGTE